ncbi:MAG: hypothetical protein KAS07_05550, partial [Candidatus Pacebacteria bacterium]|nr:hypothetical protein [Candidatus Paceibacterota bacterium]
MEAEFIEKYDKLSDMGLGDIAVSKDRERFFVCGRIATEEKKEIKVILDINNLWGRYGEWDMEQPI